MQPAAEGEHAKQLLDKAFESWAQGLKEGEADALWAYQAGDGTYRLVNGIMRGSIDPSTLTADDQQLAADVTVGVELAIAQGQVPEPVVVWRGIRDLERVFGVPPALASSLVGVERRMSGFQSTTTDRLIAIDEYLDETTGALLQLTIPAGTHAAWLPSIGDPAMAYQSELLLAADLTFRVTGQHMDGTMLVLECEVMA